MYHFNIIKNEDSSWRMELDGIQLIVDGFTVQNEMHLIKNPDKAIAFFNVNGLLYGVSNQNKKFFTAEEFYDVMREQINFFQ